MNEVGDQQVSNKKDESSKDAEKSSECTNRSGTASDDSNDSENDELLELTEEECLKRKEACLQRMSELEKRIFALHDQVYREKLNEVDTKLAEVNNGTSAEYLERLSQLERNKKVKLDVATTLRDLRIKSILIQRSANILSCQQSYKEEIQMLFDKMRDEIVDKVVDLEEEHFNRDKHVDKWISERSSNNREQKKHSSKQIKESFELPVPKKKPVTVSGPYIVYRLRDSEIMEDWTLIQKAVIESRKRRRKILCRKRYEKEFNLKMNFVPKLPDFLLNAGAAFPNPESLVY